MRYLRGELDAEDNDAIHGSEINSVVIADHLDFPEALGVTSSHPLR
jgi:hypothetical protein